MQKKLILLNLTIFLFLFGFAYSYSQVLPDVSVRSIQTTSIEITQYGYIASYVTDKFYRGRIYIPAAWLRPVINRDANAPKPVRARQIYSYNGVEKEAVMNITYADGVLSNVVIVLPSLYQIIGIPKYSGTVPVEELVSKFEAQANSPTLITEE